MDKQARLSLEDYVLARRTLGLPEYDDVDDYARYLDDRANQYKWNIGVDASLLGLLGGSIGSVGGPVGTGIGALAGAGAGTVTGAGMSALTNWLVDRRLRSFAESEKKHRANGESKTDKEDKKEKEDKEEKDGEAKNMNLTPYQEGFIGRCKARGVDPDAVIKTAQALAAQKQQREKAAEAFSKLNPYQQGFVARCAQRGVPAEKVAEFCKKLAKK